MSPHRERQIITHRTVERSPQIDEESHYQAYLARQRARQPAKEQFSFNFVNAAGIALLSFLFIPRIDYCPDSSHYTMTPEEPCLVKYNEYMTLLQVIILAATNIYYRNRPGLFTKEVKEIFDEDEMDGGGSKDDIFLENIGMIEMLIGNKLINSEKEKLKEWYELPGSKIVVFQNNREIINISSFDFVKILETKVKPFIMEQSNFDGGKKKTQKRKKSRKHK